MFKLNDILICCQEYIYNTEVIKPANVIQKYTITDYSIAKN